MHNHPAPYIYHIGKQKGTTHNLPYHNFDEGIDFKYMQ